MNARQPAMQHLAPAESVQAAGARLYADLHADIITGRMRPGASLSETKVAEEYGISRTPVREVFRRLSEEGFLRVVPQVATYVAPINLAAVADSQFIREALECRAVRLSAESASAHDIRALRQELRIQEQAANRRLREGHHKSVFLTGDHERVERVDQVADSFGPKKIGCPLLRSLVLA